MKGKGEKLKVQERQKKKKIFKRSLEGLNGLSGPTGSVSPVAGASAAPGHKGGSWCRNGDGILSHACGDGLMPSAPRGKRRSLLKAVLGKTDL